MLRNGDGFTFSPKDGGEIRGFRGDVCEGSRIICRDVPGLYVGARLRRNLSAAFEKELETNLPTRRIPVSVSLVFDDPSATSAITVKAKSEDGRVVEFDVDGGEQEATNRERMEAMFRSQIEKATGIYSFILTSLDSSGSTGKPPFMSASAINGIRREIAQRLDQMECGNCHPEHSEGSVAEEPVLYSESIDYKSNISNRVAREILQELGAKEIEDAFELTHRQGAELMRSKYCIRHELGLCLKDSSTSGPSSGSGQALRMTKGNLFLVNNGRRYRLGFDCARCEMTVSKY